MAWDTARLRNGLRIIWESSDSDVVYCGYVICAGTRHEEVGDAGMAHFIEHMTFKGTARRKSHHINNFLERVGGDLNAFTNKQETVYHATVLKSDFRRAADLLTDIVFHSTFPQSEIDKEVDVICDEIDSYKDSPADLIFDDFEAMLFRGHSLGRDILGDAHRLHEYTTADALRFARRYYRPSNAAFFVYGNVDFKKVVRLMESLTSDLSDETAHFDAQTVPAYVPATQTVKKATHQAHVIIGCRGVSGRDENLYPFILLNNILGGPGMNSLLNVRLREKSGLVYSVDSYLYTYPDTGVWEIYFGCDPADADRCRRLVRRELDRLIATPLTASRLAAAKKQLKGQTGISCNHHESYALALGKTFAHYDVHRDIRRIYDRIDGVTAAQLQNVAATFFREDNISTLVYK